MSDEPSDADDGAAASDAPAPEESSAPAASPPGEPASEQAASEEPASEESASEEPASEESASEEPASEESASEEPASEESASAEPDGVSEQEVAPLFDVPENEQQEPEAPAGASLFADEGTEDAGLGERDFDGSQPLISPEESDAIIAAMRAGSLRPPAAEPSPAPSGKVHFKSAHEAHQTQLGAPDAPLRRAMELADRVCGELADVVLDKLLQLASVIGNAQLLPSEVVSVEAALESYVATGAGWDVVGGAQNGLRGTVVIDGTLADALLARRLGAADAVLKPSAGKGLSPLGRRVMNPFAEAILDCAARSFFGQRSDIRLVPAGSTPTKLAPFAPCLKFGVRVRFQGIEGDVVVVLYDEGLVAAAAPRTRDTRSDWGRILAEVDIEVIARLGTSYASVRDFVALHVGSVLRLDGSPERPISLLVDGTPVLMGMPIVHEGNLAVEVKA